MKLSTLCLMLILYTPLPSRGQRLVPPRKYHSDDEDHDYTDDVDEEVFIRRNVTDEKGLSVGASCEFTCSPKLLHVYCNPISGLCECEKKYPVKLNNPYAGCSKPKRLGDQCYYKEACEYTDQHSSCIQIHHNAICQCKNGYHSVSIQKPSKRVFCAEDVVIITSDFSTFAGVLSGIAVLSGLICFVLHLFNQNLYGTRHHRHRFGNANLAPPILFSSDPDGATSTISLIFLDGKESHVAHHAKGSLPLPIIDRSLTSRASSHRTFASMPSRRASSAPGCRGISVSASRAGAARAAAILLLSYCHVAPFEVSCHERADTKFGSRRPSIASVHSSSSIRSYSTRRYERERLQKEEREMDRRYSKMTRSSSTTRIAPTPSPHSTDDLLPTLEEDKQIPPLAMKEESSSSFHEEMPSTSKQYP